MILSDLEAEIFRGLKEPATGGHFSEPEILRRINIGQRMVVRKTGCMTSINTSTTTADGTSAYDKPDKTLSVKRVYYEDVGNRLFPITTAELDVRSQLGEIGKPWSDDQGTPTHYYQTISQVCLYPKPDDAQTLGIEVILRPNALVNANDVPFNDLDYMEDYHDLLVSFVLWRCLLEDQNDFYKEHKEQFLSGILEIKSKVVLPGESLDTFRLARRSRGTGRNPLPFMDG